MCYVKKWKIIKRITVGIIIVFIAIVIINAISYYVYDDTYPYPALGIDIHNWQEQFYLNMTFMIYILSIPLAIDILLLIILTVKIRKLKNN